MSVEGQYAGAALQVLMRGLPSRPIVGQILAAHGLHRIDDSEWYPLSTVLSIYQMVGKKIGNRALHAVGLQMINAAPFPLAIKDIKGILMSLNEAYHMNTRGSEIGSISSSFEDDHSAVVIFATPFPCALAFGILQGCCKRYLAAALIEHGADGCADEGAPSCMYRITW